MHAQVAFGTAMARIVRLTLLSLVVLLLTACGGNKKASTSATTTPAVNPPTTGSGAKTTPPAPNPPAKLTAKGRLSLGTKDFYPRLGGSLRSFTPGQLTGKNVPVLTVVGPSSFWVGTNATLRLLVSVRLKGRPPAKVKAGQRADFIGALLPTSDPEASSINLKVPADRSKLDQQGAFLSVSIGDLKLH